MEQTAHILCGVDRPYVYAPIQTMDALHLLGMVAYAVKQFDHAAALIRRAIAVNPSAAMYHNNLGVSLRGLGELEAAAECYLRAVGLKPDYAEALASAPILTPASRKARIFIERRIFAAARASKPRGLFGGSIAR